ncbi:MAG: HPF/RaiA family ribosome-associated protein [Ignavibacteriales bacterium]|nr:HPF/RaiA family ribosome-associated protein [Ignavibacteriales bacterium]
MNIQINTGHNIQSNETLIAKFRSIIENSLSRISDHITSVEVHMKDEDGAKKGKNDKRCMIEARLEGRQPIVVTDHSDTLNEALDNAINKLINMIESILGRQKDKRSHDSKQPAPEIEFPEEK